MSATVLEEQNPLEEVRLPGGPPGEHQPVVARRAAGAHGNATGTLDAALGPSEIGFATELAWTGLDGMEYRETVIKRAVTIPTVSQNVVLDVEGRRVGVTFSGGNIGIQRFAELMER